MPIKHRHNEIRPTCLEGGMTIVSNLGFPRIGRRRELKFSLERFWTGTLDEAGLLSEAAQLRALHWRLQVGWVLVTYRQEMPPFMTMCWIPPVC